MFLNDPFENFRRAGSVPHTLGVNHRNRAIQAEPKAICLSPCHSPGATQAEFIQPGFQVIPCCYALVFPAALGFGLIGTYKDMPLDLVDVKRSCDLAEFRIG